MGWRHGRNQFHSTGLSAHGDWRRFYSTDMARCHLGSRFHSTSLGRYADLSQFCSVDVSRCYFGGRLCYTRLGGYSNLTQFHSTGVRRCDLNPISTRHANMTQFHSICLQWCRNNLRFSFSPNERFPWHQFHSTGTDPSSPGVNGRVPRRGHITVCLLKGVGWIQPPFPVRPGSREVRGLLAEGPRWRVQCPSPHGCGGEGKEPGCTLGRHQGGRRRDGCVRVWKRQRDRNLSRDEGAHRGSGSHDRWGPR